MLDPDGFSLEFPFKILCNGKDSFICSAEADDSVDPNDQLCWRISGMNE
jgi:hypothetical protein